MNGGYSIIYALLLAACLAARAGEADYRGQLSLWTTLTDEDSEVQVGARYIGELSLSVDLNESWRLSAEAAVDANGYGLVDDRRDVERDGDLDPYRLWLRLASPQFEARGGLQKICFGSATLLRPLMWFDTLDPRDPLQLTDGVYGLLGRYSFLNNASIWGWGLYGNDDLRGWEVVPTDDREMEWGGRVQVPVGTGEMAFSCHHRRADPAGSALDESNPDQAAFPEDRLGLDGKWDIGVGVWFEAVLTRQELDRPQPRYRRQAVVGSDYTFSVGNGLHVLGEHYVSDVAESAFGSGDSRSISALSFSYPLGMFDTLAAFAYYDWEGDTGTPLLQWRRTYDHWQIHISAFGTIGGRQRGSGLAESGLPGNGMRAMLVFTH